MPAGYVALRVCENDVIIMRPANANDWLFDGKHPSRLVGGKNLERMGLHGVLLVLSLVYTRKTTGTKQLSSSWLGALDPAPVLRESFKINQGPVARAWAGSTEAPLGLDTVDPRS
jgi:hypothetical protein